MAEPTTGGTPASAEAAAPPPSLDEAREWTGHRIDEFGGSSIARIQGVFVDWESGEPVWVIAKLGRFGKVIAIPFQDCAAGVGHVWVPYARSELRGAPVLDPSRPLTREQELAICGHYGIPEELGRAKELAVREAGSVTSQPA